MDPELIVAAIQREREAEFARLDRIRRAKAQRAAATPGEAVPWRPRLLLRVTRALSSRARARAQEAGCRKLEADPPAS
jgi:hypothetical protein